ncbi:MAG: hypothetical protein OJF61_002047 [Rhodanobacteraceae bacterium]|nr:MAG: hypothetical protein OJF61_002047 [Rhodanobacteraceae bacterium]
MEIGLRQPEDFIMRGCASPQRVVARVRGGRQRNQASREPPAVASIPSPS